MLIATILLIANLIALIYNGTPLFGFLNFLWIYPLEIAVYLIIVIIITIIEYLLTE